MSERPEFDFHPANLELIREMRPFLDTQGRLRQWPAKQRLREMAIAYLATRFEPGTTYREREVNDLLDRWHTFGDRTLLRRYLVDLGYLERERDGSRYWLAPANG